MGSTFEDDAILGAVIVNRCCEELLTISVVLAVKMGEGGRVGAIVG